MTCSVVFIKLGFRLLLSTKSPTFEGNDEQVSRIFLIKLLATQTNSKSGENVSHITGAGVVENSGAKTDIQVE